MPCPKGMLGCRRGCLHRQHVEEYWLARYVEEQARESACSGYRIETADYGPLVTFREWLVQTTGWSGRREETAT